MKETKIFTINKPEIANDFVNFLEGNEITFIVTDCSYDYLNPRFIFKCEMDETETRIAETIIKYGAAAYRSTGEYNKLDMTSTQMNILPSTSKTFFKKLLLNNTNNLPIIKFHSNKNAIPEIKELVFNDPATIIFWEDGTKTIVKTQNSEPFDKEKGFCMAVVKKLFGNKGNYYNIVDEWINKKAKIYDDSSKKKSNFLQLINRK